ncbi:hypothetical protein VKT23_010884 [Stygiomarasmius scandens]|uniref:MYND-type domain-containing protein n=1 Tax=Marasmiellus scandens TaxID=2682957 RepID=A0ABR1JAH9_9AGAR
MSKPEDNPKYSGGVTVSKEMKDILSKPGFLKSNSAGGGQRLRTLYQKASVNFDSRQLSPFGTACYFGIPDEVARLYSLAGGYVDLKGHESGFNLGYISLVTLGSQRVTILGGQPTKHIETLKFLIGKGADVNTQDICGLSPLQHACKTGIQNVQLSLQIMRTLLENGAKVDHQNRYGETALFFCFTANNTGALDILLEFGADLDIPEADGITPRSFYMKGGPAVTAVVTKWVRKRNGEEELPRQGKKCCDGCGKEDVALKNCGRCQVARYCSAECQKKQWPTHKSKCQPFSTPNTVTLKPCYKDMATLMPISSHVRRVLGYPDTPIPERNYRGAHVPKKLIGAKSLIVKIQVPLVDTPDGERPAPGDEPLVVYTKKRDFVCSIKKGDQANGGAAYDTISDVIKKKGHRGAKAYFAAELRSKDELVVKISEVLAEQPF